MPDQSSLARRLVTEAWGVLGKQKDASGARRFFSIPLYDSTKYIHILAYTNSDASPDTVFSQFQSGKTNLPFVEVIEGKNGDVYLTCHGNWEKTLGVSVGVPKKFPLSDKTDDAQNKFSEALIKAAHAVIRENTAADPEKLYKYFAEKYKREHPRESQESKLQRSFKHTAHLLTTWNHDAHSGITRVTPPLSSLRPHQ